MDCLLDSAFEVAPEGAPKDVLKNLCKDSQEATITYNHNHESKQMLDSAFEVSPEGAPKDVLKDLCKDSQEATITYNHNHESKQNF